MTRPNAFWSLLNLLLNKIHRNPLLQLQHPLYRLCGSELSTVTYTNTICCIKRNTQYFVHSREARMPQAPLCLFVCLGLGLVSANTLKISLEELLCLFVCLSFGLVSANTLKISLEELQTEETKVQRTAATVLVVSRGQPHVPAGPLEVVSLANKQSHMNPCVV